jgi:DUF218 domain
MTSAKTMNIGNNSTQKLLVVLGHENDSSGNLSPDAESRCRCAYDVYVASPTPIQIMLTGGFGAYFNASDTAHCVYLKRRLIGLGIPEAAFVDSAITSGTLEDGYKVFSHVRSSSSRYTEIHVVTSEFHLSRVHLIFQRLFPEKEIEYHPAQNAMSGRDLEAQMRHESNRIRETERDWVDVFNFDHSLVPNQSLASLGEEIRHYDNLSNATIAAGIVCFGTVVANPGAIESMHVRVASFLICAAFLIFLHYLYRRFANTAGSARRVLHAVTCIYGVPTLASTQTVTFFFGKSIKTTEVVLGIIYAMVFTLIGLIYLNLR